VSDIFGDLREWGRIPEQIEQLRLSGRLDEHEEGLTRVLRYRYNWQLREAALRVVPDIREPSKDLLDVLLQIVPDEYCALETRLLACEAVRHVISRTDAEGSAVAQIVDDTLRAAFPPVLRKVVERWRIPIFEPVIQSAKA